MRHRVIVLAAMMLAAALLAPAAFARTTRTSPATSCPRASTGSVPTAATRPTSRREMYNALTPLFNHVTSADVVTDFKPEPIGIGARAGPSRRRACRTRRDDLPRRLRRPVHLRHHARRRHLGRRLGRCRGPGTAAQQARYNARVAAIDAAGAEGDQPDQQPRSSFTPSAQTEDEVAKQTEALLAARRQRAGPCCTTSTSTSRGSTPTSATRIRASRRSPATTSTRSTRSRISSSARGGASRRSTPSSCPRSSGGWAASAGSTVWNDLREANDPEAPASVPGHVQFQPPPEEPQRQRAARPRTACRRARSDGARGAARLRAVQASNELMVSGARSATHHPIMVAGPQIGYYYPGLTTEIDLEGAGHPPARRDHARRSRATSSSGAARTRPGR